MEAHLTQTGVEELVADWDEDDQSQGIEVVDDIVGKSVKFHGRSLLSEVVGELSVREPVERIPHEDFACRETTSHFVYPGIIEGHPRWSLISWDVGWLGRCPHGSVVGVLVESDRVDRPSSSQGVEQDLERLAESRSSGRSLLISLSAPPHNSGSEKEGECWEQECQPETDVLLGVDHTNLSDKGTDVDEQVEVVVDPTLCNRRVNDDLLTGWQFLDDDGSQGNLFDNQR